MNIMKSFKKRFLFYKSQKYNQISCKKGYFDIKGKNNKINTKLNKKDEKKITIKIEGNNNIIEIGHTLNVFNRLYIYILGDNNSIKLENNIAIVDALVIQILENCSNSYVTIGKDTSFWNTTIQTSDSNSFITIGEDCMFSYNTNIINCDGHSIFKDNNLINKGESIEIGKHCWVGYSSVIYKNSRLPDNTIVARNAFVTSSSKKITEEYIAIAGIPAKIVKRGVTWSRKTPNESCKETTL